LLERTQARKNQLNKKREELEACRARRNSPIKDRSRRPLSEDNTESSLAEVHTDDIKRRRIGSDESDKASTGKSFDDIDVNSPSVQARKDRLLKMQMKDQENGVTPKKHWKPAIAQATNSDSSPSVASRSAAFEVNQKEEHEENIKGKVVGDGQTFHTPGKLTETRNIFEKASGHRNTESKTEMSLVPPKPPRSYTNESSPEEIVIGEVEQVTKRKAPSPPKVAEESLKANKAMDKQTSFVKRKAPEPPGQDKNKMDINNTHESCKWDGVQSNNIKQKKVPSHSLLAVEEEDGIVGPIPTKRERKGSIGNQGGINESKTTQPTPTPRKYVPAAPEEKNTVLEGGRDRAAQMPRKIAANTIVSIVAAPVDDSKRAKETQPKQRLRVDPVVIQACVVDERSSDVSSKSICSNESVVEKVELHSDCSSKSYTIKSTGSMKMVGINENEKCLLKETDKRTEGAAASKKKSCTSSNKDRQPPKKNELEFEIPKNSTAAAREICSVDLDETVDLNDVNIHEMTFSFDFNQFDQQLEEQKDTMFVSYEEKCKQLRKEHERKEPKKNKDHTSSSIHSPDITYEREERGTYQSGYNSNSSEQYATKTIPKLKPPVEQRPTKTQDAIKTLLEEAAYQQNIVLQASQALNICVANDITFRGSTEEIEAERVLLLASQHRTACLDEVQKLKMGSSEVSELAEGDAGYTAPSCIASLSLSGLKIILRQDFMDVLRVGIRSDLGVFYFVSIVQHGPHEFYCTRVLSTNDADKGNFLLFPEKFTLNDIKPDFNVTIKVFCMNVKKTVINTVATPTKHKIFQSPKVVKGMFVGARKDQRRGSDTPTPAQVIPSPQTVFRTSSFSLVGVTHVNLPIIKSKRFSLDKVPDNCPLSNELEIEAEFSPLYSSHVKGFLTVLEDIGGYGAWQRRWCVLEGAVISYWRYPGDESTKPPLGCIDLSQCMSDEVTRVARDLCARPNTMELKLKRSCGTEVRYLLAADTKSDRATWIDSLNEALRDGRAWTINEKSPLYPDLSRVHNQDVYMCSKKNQH